MILVIKLKELYNIGHPVKCNVFEKNIIEIKEYKKISDIQDVYGDFFVEKINVDELDMVLSIKEKKIHL